MHLLANWICSATSRAKLSKISFESKSIDPLLRD